MGRKVPASRVTITPYLGGRLAASRESPRSLGFGEIACSVEGNRVEHRRGVDRRLAAYAAACPELRSLGSSLGPWSGIPLPILGLDEGQGLLDEGRPIGLGHDRSDLIELARDRLGEGEAIGRLGIGLEQEALGAIRQCPS